MTGIELGRDGQIAQLGEPAADVLDVFVDSEDFLYDEDNRQCSSLLGPRSISGDVTIAGP